MTIAVISGNVFYQYHLATVPRVDLLPILTKEEKEENDYKVIYEQTGLTKEGYLRIEDDIDLILDIQNDYYSSYNIIKKNTAPFLMSDFLDRKVSHCLVKKGDIIITSAVQFSGIRLGHTALVINEEEIIEAVGYGSLSHINKVDSFMERPSFLIVSPNFDEDVKEEVVNYALDNLLGIPYNIFAGVFTKKSEIKSTQCAHLVWYAYYKNGIDLDDNKGLIITPKQLANSSRITVIQNFGFNSASLWN